MLTAFLNQTGAKGKESNKLKTWICLYPKNTKLNTSRLSKLKKKLSLQLNALILKDGFIKRLRFSW